MAPLPVAHAAACFVGFLMGYAACFLVGLYRPVQVVPAEELAAEPRLEEGLVAEAPVVDESAGDSQVGIDVRLLALQFALAGVGNVHCICDLPVNLYDVGSVSHFTCPRYHRYPDDRRTVLLPFLFQAVDGLLELVEPGRQGELVAPPYQLQLRCVSPRPPAASPSPSFVETPRRRRYKPAPVVAIVPAEEPLGVYVPAGPNNGQIVTKILKNYFSLKILQNFSWSQQKHKIIYFLSLSSSLTKIIVVL